MLVAVLALSVAPAQMRSPSLFAQSAAAALAGQPQDARVSYLLFDVATGTVIGVRWDNVDQPISPGSLLKPFVAATFAVSHAQFPEVTCKGAASSCWLPHGHGRVTLRDAVAHSCNTYFRSLAAQVTRTDVEATCARYRLTMPDGISPDALIGLHDGWRVSPVALVNAYLKLLKEHDGTAQAITSGMSEAARRGTGVGAAASLRHTRVLVKTGTAVCSHAPRAPGDGFALVLAPADSPQVAMLVRVHGTTGANAAGVAGKMLNVIFEPGEAR